MATMTEYRIPRYSGKKAWLVIADRTARNHLQEEFEQAGWEVASQPTLDYPAAPFDTVLVDVGLLRDPGDIKAVKGLRAALPAARLVLLVPEGEPRSADSTLLNGFDLALAYMPGTRPSQEVVRRALGYDSQTGPAAPVEIDFGFLPGVAPRRIAPRGNSVEAVPVARKLGFLPKPGEANLNHRSPWLLAGLVFNVSLVLAGLALPVLQLEAINYQPALAVVMLTAPPPPPPPPPSRRAPTRRPAKRPTLRNAQLSLPEPTPRKLAAIDQALAQEDLDSPEGAELTFGDIAGGIPGGILGGIPGGVAGGVLGSTALTFPAPPPPPEGPVRVGGKLQAPALIRRVLPVYSLMAKRARIQGTVRIDAIINEEGRVVEVSVLSGPPLLVPSALAAVKKWVFQPTYLNGRPVAVAFVVTLNFTLGRGKSKKGAN